MGFLFGFVVWTPLVGMGGGVIEEICVVLVCRCCVEVWVVGGMASGLTVCER